MNEPTNNAYSIFLSYTSPDRKVARQVVQGLMGAGINVWWDQGGIGWGDDWQEKLEKALNHCGAYVILLGRDGVRRWVKPELGVAMQRHVDDGLPILPLLLDGVALKSLPPFLSLFQTRSLPEDLRDFDFAVLATELASAIQPTEPLAKNVCPFPGLAIYEEYNADFFLGRQADTLALLQRLGPGLDGVQRRWLQVEGPSGVGKSSLVRAGLIPAVRNGWLEETQPADWQILILRPGVKPLEALASELERALKDQADIARIDNLRSIQRSDKEDLAYLLKVALTASQRLLLIIDQFEELFTLTEDEQACSRLDALLAQALRDSDCPLYLTTTIRSDFLLHFDKLPHLQVLLNERAGRYDLRPLGVAGLREVVRIPAQRAGLVWSEPSLPDRIVEDAIDQRAPLPLVANLLRLLWDGAHKRGDQILSEADYRQLKGVAGALARSADLLLASLGSKGKERARGLLLALVNPGRESPDTRRSISRELALEAAGGGPLAEQVLDRLSGLRTAENRDPVPRLVVITQVEGGAENIVSHQVDLSHEALLRLDHQGQPYWRTLWQWVAENRKALQDRDLLEVLSNHWVEQGRPRLSGLATGQQLKDFFRVTGARNPAPAYLRASRWRRWYLRAVFTVPLLALVLFFDGLWLQTQGLGYYDQYTRTLAYLGRWTGWGGFYLEPKMVSLDGGIFEMGCVSGNDCKNDERPIKQRRIKAFLLGRYEVTFAQYDQFVIATQSHNPERSYPDDEAWGRATRPVINVSWYDAKAYVDWLAVQTGKQYRLPSEAEWEYAARASKRTRWSFGDDENVLREYAWFDENSGSKTHPIGGLEPNLWGLYDMHGNVKEWVQDCWHESYQEAPDDGSAWETGDCKHRVLRSGSWFRRSWFLRSAYREKFMGDLDDFDVGFRVAQGEPDK